MDYLLGHTQSELSRLELQGRIFAQPTARILSDAGLKPGMRVLDVGCGTGDVSIISAKLVGSEGSVVGIDRAGEALDIARSRIRDADLAQISLQQADLNDLPADQLFDAVVGRFILTHQPDPGAAVRTLTRQVAPGGIIAFIEMDISTASAVPAMTLFSQCLDWILGAYHAAGNDPDMGSKLYPTLRSAGLEPKLDAHLQVEAGPTSTAYDYMAETIASLLPSLESQEGIDPNDIGVDTLADRLRAEASDNHVFYFPRLVGAYAKQT